MEIEKNGFDKSIELLHKDKNNEEIPSMTPQELYSYKTFREMYFNIGVLN